MRRRYRISDKAKPRCGQGKQRGVGLIEVQIAALVFSVGILGLASMQLGAKRASYEASQRSIATGLARDILERMRSNPGQLAAYVVSEVGDEDNPRTNPVQNCAATVCNPAQLASYDLWDWESLLFGGLEKLGGDNTGGLVSPRACISHSDGSVTVAIAWLGLMSASDPAESSCGNSAGALYDDPDENPGNMRRRRLLVMSSYVGRP